MTIREMAVAAKQASLQLPLKSGEEKNQALLTIAEILENNSAKIFAANKIDLANAEKDQLSLPLLKRLKFDESKLAEVLAGIRSLVTLPDPVGQTLAATEMDKGLELYKLSCPIGVIGVIFESRPDALIQISTLCLKSGNAALLKGGSEAAQTNRVLFELLCEAGEKAGMPANWVQLLESRAEVGEMLKQDEYVDLIIPRGSNDFVKYIKENSNISVLGHADGICHLYVDSEADLAMALELSVDSKCQYVSVCNALETLLVHRQVAAEFLPLLKSKLLERGVEIFACPEANAIIDQKEASEEDWKSEYLDTTLAIKVVQDLTAATEHINKYGSGHTDVIITENPRNAEKFINAIDSADIFWNCSSRFSDGFRFGFGAEVGISTNKIHARGPVGLDGLMIYKWIVKGSGQKVADYAEGRKQFTHKKLDKKLDF